MRTEEIRAFLTHLAVEGRVAASTQNVALQALLRGPAAWDCGPAARRAGWPSVVVGAAGEGSPWHGVGAGRLLGGAGGWAASGHDAGGGDAPSVEKVV